MAQGVKMHFLNPAFIQMLFQPALKLPGIHTLIRTCEDKMFRGIRQEALTQRRNVRHKRDLPQGTVAFRRTDYQPGLTAFPVPFLPEMSCLSRQSLGGMADGNELVFHGNIPPAECAYLPYPHSRAQRQIDTEFA